ncbi:MAG: 2-C-methyl-D-erythritol 2,4-cyclodiphosphate synthase [Spirochaetaceae bacterium]|nr:2-C-methyl-D-erythritol 2,4-cyclodiphosphate synthase [Spirochaetaceae bacterium]
MGSATKKEYLCVDGKPLLLFALEAFEESRAVSRYVVTVPPGGEEEARGVLAPWLDVAARKEATSFVPGGQTRQESVYRGLAALSAAPPGLVLIHDGARPWVKPGLIRAVAQAAASRGACIPLTPAVDALKQINAEGFLESHLDRGRIRGAQTPQGFLYGKIFTAHQQAARDGRSCHDDSEIYSLYAGPVFSVPGDERNKKITYPADLEEASAMKTQENAAAARVGFGYDLHRLVEGRRLLLGGVHLSSPRGEDGHSDGDVLVHAVIDALLGAAGLGDIGEHFPPQEAAWKDADSRNLLRRVMQMIDAAGLRVGNLDCTVVLESPKILPYKKAVAENLAEDLRISPAAISVKGKTKEKVDAVGEGRAVEAFATVLLINT